jgi:hypothetical protein
VRGHIVPDGLGSVPAEEDRARVPHPVSSKPATANSAVARQVAPTARRGFMGQRQTGFEPRGAVHPLSVSFS